MTCGLNLSTLQLISGQLVTMRELMCLWVQTHMKKLVTRTLLVATVTAMSNIVQFFTSYYCICATFLCSFLLFPVTLIFIIYILVVFKFLNKCNHCFHLLHKNSIFNYLCLSVVTQICKLLWWGLDEQDCRSSGIFSVLGRQCYNGQHMFTCWNWGKSVHLFFLQQDNVFHHKSMSSLSCVTNYCQ